jgi:hypothetical protein
MATLESTRVRRRKLPAGYVVWIVIKWKTPTVSRIPFTVKQPRSARSK